MANLKRAQYGKVDLDYVLGIGGFDLERFPFFHRLLLDLLLSWKVYHLSDNYMPLKQSYTSKEKKENTSR